MSDLDATKSTRRTSYPARDQTMTLQHFRNVTADVDECQLRHAMTVALVSEIPSDPEGYRRF